MTLNKRICICMHISLPMCQQKQMPLLPNVWRARGGASCCDPGHRLYTHEHMKRASHVPVWDTSLFYNRHDLLSATGVCIALYRGYCNLRGRFLAAESLILGGGCGRGGAARGSRALSAIGEPGERHEGRHRGTAGALH